MDTVEALCVPAPGTFLFSPVFSMPCSVTMVMILVFMNSMPLKHTLLKYFPNNHGVILMILNVCQKDALL